MSGSLEKTWLQKVGLPPYSKQPRGRLFLVGNGKSLEHTPMGLLIGEEAWATGRIHLIYDRTHWRPTRYFSTENPATAKHMEDIIFHIDQGYDCWVRRDITHRFQGLAPNVTPWAYCPGGHTGGLMYKPDGELSTRFPTEFHLDPEGNWFCKMGPGMSVMLGVALYEGWGPIYLVGCDLGYEATSTDKDPNHFDDAYSLEDYDEQRAFNEEQTQIAVHTMAEVEFTKRGVKVYNATVGGKLEIYPRADIQEVLGGGGGERTKSND